MKYKTLAPAGLLVILVCGLLLGTGLKARLLTDESGCKEKTRHSQYQKLLSEAQEETDESLLWKSVFLHLLIIRS